MSKPLHQLIEENSKRIVDQFVAEARTHDLPARTLTHAEVVDHLHRYLGEIVAVLRGGLAHSVRSSPAAKEHGEQRWYVGYDLKSVILEYGLFRKVILDIVKDAGGELTFEECDPLGQFINVAIADAAVEFMEISLLQVNEALQRAEQAKSAREEVVAIVSHDLKNPLHVIHGSAELLSGDLESTDLEAKRAAMAKSLARIQRATASMSTLIEDLLDLERIRAGEFHLSTQPHNVEDLVRDAVEHAMPLAEERAIALSTEVSQASTITCDRERVLQVLANLLGNAIKFNRQGGTVKVRASCSADVCTFEVTDTGPGIPSERLPYVFNRFWQAPDTAAQGTGLGLAIAKGFVELHGGRIWCTSEVDRGSSFFFTLPSGGLLAEASSCAEEH